ncbi:phosphoglycolate phosphatase [Paraburkholderia sp. LEh10]|uniref:phosphoglycolate phosphatase n=1 Tax=Paraburkholderia sp. LEh10 TaxID=2821353 RepID=UPI001AE43263|nr:phosphoglycolate phosphatase [Paraburkholderia sp. LEh10]MBP0595654.1 phosphoglycolate phosphatase [Paraburkholderia sp. LEh10]
MESRQTICQTVLIDLDGTLVDSAPDIVAAANQMLADLRTAPLPFDTVAGFIGKGVPNLVRRSLEASGIDGTADPAQAEALFHRHYARINGSLSRVFPGVVAGLDALRAQGYRLGCVTNKPESLAAQLLATTGLAAYLEVLIGGDTIAQMKPDPEPVRHACRLLGADVARSVLVGDSPVDVATARGAGIPVYIVRYGYAGPAGAEALDCDDLLDSLEDLPDILEPGRRVSAA